jgi:spore germination protein YaaH
VRTTTALLVALVGLGLAPSAASADGRADCMGKAPRALSFERKPGKLTGRLSWRPPSRALPGTRYRVYRNGVVVGQTTGRSMQVRVSLERTYRFRVHPVSSRGRPLPCGALLERRVSYRRPARPRNLAAARASGATVRLTWSASRPGDAPVVGYRVFRDGSVYGQTRSRKKRIPLASNRRHTFTVRAVDRNNKLSAPSNAVTVKTGHRAPPAPTALRATAVGETEVSLSWKQKKPPRGRVAGYRLYRDGKVVRQVARRSATIANLAAATRYTFTVAAVDGLGYLSPQSKPLSAITAMPQPTAGHAHAFLLASTGQSFADFRAHYRQIGTVYPTYYDCNANGSLVGADNPLITGWAKLRRVQVLPRFNCQSGAVLHRILNEPALRTFWLDRMTALVAQHAYDGLNIDFEAGYASDRAALTSFVAELAARLHAQGKKLSIDVSAKTTDVQNHPRSTFFDYLALSAHADHVVVMAWGIHWATSAPGAADDLAWWTQVADYVATMPRKERFVMGLQLYGMDWASGGGAAHPGTAHEYADVQALLARTGAVPRYDAAAGAMHFSYTDAAGAPHEVWYTDAATQATRLALARARGLGGVAFWRLGREHQLLWANPLLAPGAVWR